MANTITYETLFEDVLQDRLDRPTSWKETCDVIYTPTRAISSSYMSTTPAVQSVTRGTAFTLQDFGETADTLTISTGRDVPIYVDWADLSQSPWTKPMEIFDRIGALLNEFIETNVLAQHASWTDIGNTGGGAVGLTATTLTVSATNIDDIIRGVKREIRAANGQFFMNQSGVFNVWRPADFELLEAFAQANGFASADKFLGEGTVEGLHYLGSDHYWTNDNAANHLFAGVKKTHRLGILQGTYGKAHTIEFPAGGSNNNLSGVAYYSRVDIGHLIPSAHSTIIFDINVA